MEGTQGALPFGVTSVDALAGRAVQIRDEGGVLYLFGFVPSLSDDDSPSHAHKPMHPLVPGHGQMRLRDVPKHARRRFEVRATDLQGHHHVAVRVENPTTHQMTTIGVIAVNKNDHAVLRRDTEKGEALPFGQTQLKPLIGLDVEVRDAVTQELLLTGKVPKL